MRRGQIWWAELDEPRASEPGYRRPVVIVQADEFNNSRIQTVIVVAITSNTSLADAPGNVYIPKSTTKLQRDSVANVSQLLTLDRRFLVEEIDQLSYPIMHEIDAGLQLILSL